MRRRTSRRAPVAILALAAPLILSSAGQRSDPAASGEAQGAEGAVCQAVPASNAQRDIDPHLDRLVASGEIAGSPEVVVLNNRGYNYGPTPQPELGALRLEAELRRQR